MSGSWGKDLGILCVPTSSTPHQAKTLLLSSKSSSSLSFLSLPNFTPLRLRTSSNFILPNKKKEKEKEKISQKIEYHDLNLSLLFYSSLNEKKLNKKNGEARILVKCHGKKKKGKIILSLFFYEEIFKIKVYIKRNFISRQKNGISFFFLKEKKKKKNRRGKKKTQHVFKEFMRKNIDTYMIFFFSCKNMPSIYIYVCGCKERSNNISRCRSKLR